jgi:putative intracellular protease/amidase
MSCCERLGPIPDPVTGADRTPASEIAFVKAQAPKAQYVMSVCIGSAILGYAGVLSGKRATTNKSLFKLVEVRLTGCNRLTASFLKISFRSLQKVTPKDITWVAKARWVVDGNIWTSSGVNAGMFSLSHRLLAMLTEVVVLQDLTWLLPLSLTWQDLMSHTSFVVRWKLRR